MSRKPYIRQKPNTWWMRNSFYRAYMMREFSSIFIAIYAVVLLVGLVRLSQGAQAWEGWLAALQSPLSIGLNGVSLLFALYHSVSWFKLAPQAIPPQISGIRIRAGLVIGLHYVAFFLLSIIVVAWATL